MKFLSQRFIFIILSLVFVIGAFIVYSNFIKPEYAAVSELRSQLATKTETLDRYEASYAKLQSVLGGQDVGQLKESVSRILPNTPDFAYLSAQIVGFARLDGLGVTSISNSLDPIKSSSSKIIRSVGKVKTIVKLTGSYSGVRSFVQQIESDLLLMDVDSFTADEQKGQMEYTITLASYYQTQ